MLPRSVSVEIKDSESSNKKPLPIEIIFSEDQFKIAMNPENDIVQKEYLDHHNKQFRVLKIVEAYQAANKFEFCIKAAVVTKYAELIVYPTIKFYDTDKKKQQRTMAKEEFRAHFIKILLEITQEKIITPDMFVEVLTKGLTKNVLEIIAHKQTGYGVFFYQYSNPLPPKQDEEKRPVPVL